MKNGKRLTVIGIDPSLEVFARLGAALRLAELQTEAERIRGQFPGIETLTLHPSAVAPEVVNVREAVTPSHPASTRHTKRKGYTRTPEQRKRMSRAQRKSWRKRRGL